jgi:hypothetical protein
VLKFFEINNIGPCGARTHDLVCIRHMLPPTELMDLDDRQTFCFLRPFLKSCELLFVVFIHPNLIIYKNIQLLYLLINGPCGARTHDLVCIRHMLPPTELMDLDDRQTFCFLRPFLKSCELLFVVFIHPNLIIYKNIQLLYLLINGPCGARTHDLVCIRHMLPPTELMDRFVVVYIYKYVLHKKPNAGLEPATPRLRVLCSTD